MSSYQEDAARKWDQKAADSIRAPIGNGRARIEYTPVPITDLGPSLPPDWVWPGYIARGHTTLFTGLWKAGKSTLIGHLLAGLAVGGGLIGEPTKIKTMIVTEESPTLWCRRREDLELTAAVELLVRPFVVKPDMCAWQGLIAQVTELVKSRGYGLVIFDTLPSFWPVTDENNASEVGAALLPLNAITATGAAVLLVHHPRKGDAGEGQASRGSGALPGFVDVIVELRRFAAEDARDRRRVLRAYSRFDETPAEAVLELTDSGYVVVGNRAEVKQADRLGAIATLLPEAGPGLTAAEVLEAWPTAPKPGKRAIELDLAHGANANQWARTGKGVKHDPLRYWRPPGFVSRTVPPIGARNESDPTWATVGLNGTDRENHP